MTPKAFECGKCGAEMSTEEAIKHPVDCTSSSLARAAKRVQELSRILDEDGDRMSEPCNRMPAEYEAEIAALKQDHQEAKRQGRELESELTAEKRKAEKLLEALEDIAAASETVSNSLAGVFIDAGYKDRAERALAEYKEGGK